MPGGASHVRPSRPRPAVWKSATATVPSGIDGSSSTCVDSHASTCDARLAELHAQRLDAHGRHLVLRRPDQRVADVVR